MKGSIMSKTLVSLVSFVAMLVLGWSYSTAGKATPEATRLVLKGGTTMVAALLAFYGAYTGGDRAAWLLAAGIAVCAAADVLLEKKFLAGMACFALGHMLYITAFLKTRPVGSTNIMVFAVLAVIALVVAWLLRTKLSPLPAYILYGLLISAMAALATSQPLIAAAGAFLFLLSDLVLAFRLAGTAPGAWGHMVMICYYLGQYLLGLSAVYR